MLSMAHLIRGMQTKTTMIDHLAPVRRTIIKTLPIANVGEDVEKRDPPPYTVGGNVNWCSPCGKQYGGVSEKENRTNI